MRFLDEHDIDMSYEKHAAWVILGSTVAPDLALEIIRRTDGFFCSEGDCSPYTREVRRLLGLPNKDDFRVRRTDGSDEIDEDGFFRALGRYLAHWGFLYSAPGRLWIPMTGILGNDMITSGFGWCYPDGTIAMVGEVERGYPHAILNECRLLAAAFPEVELSIGYWGRGSGEAPSVGFMVRGGQAIATYGDEPGLFADFNGATAATVRDVTEQVALSAKRQLIEHSRFGDRHQDSEPLTRLSGVPDAAIDIWVRKAQSLGLIS